MDSMSHNVGTPINCIIIDRSCRTNTDVIGPLECLLNLLNLSMNVNVEWQEVAVSSPVWAELLCSRTCFRLKL